MRFIRPWVLGAALLGLSTAGWLGAPPSASAALVKWAIHSLPGRAPETGANPEIAAVHDDKLRQPAVLKAAYLKTEVWIKPLDRGQWAVALFNNGERTQQVDLIWKDLGLKGSPKVRDLATGANRGKIHGGFAEKLPPGGAALFLVSP